MGNGKYLELAMIGAELPEVNGLDECPFTVKFEHNDETYYPIYEQEINADGGLLSTRKMITEIIRNQNNVWREINTLKANQKRKAKLVAGVIQNTAAKNSTRLACAEDRG